MTENEFTKAVKPMQDHCRQMADEHDTGDREFLFIFIFGMIPFAIITYLSLT